MGATREKHSENCAAELAALGWWPGPDRAVSPKDLCQVADF